MMGINTFQCSVSYKWYKINFDIAPLHAVIDFFFVILLLLLCCERPPPPNTDDITAGGTGPKKENGAKNLLKKYFKIKQQNQNTQVWDI